LTFSKKFLTLALATTTTSVFANNTTVEEIEVPVVKCSQPVISISIAEIECKAANC